MGNLYQSYEENGFELHAHARKSRSNGLLPWNETLSSWEVSHYSKNWSFRLKLTFSATITQDCRMGLFMKEFRLKAKNLSAEVLLRSGLRFSVWVITYDVIKSQIFNRKKSCMAPFLDALIPVVHQKPITDYNYGYQGVWLERRKQSSNQLKVQNYEIITHLSTSILSKKSKAGLHCENWLTKLITISKGFKLLFLIIFKKLIRKLCYPSVIFRSPPIDYWKV